MSLIWNIALCQTAIHIGIAGGWLIHRIMVPAGVRIDSCTSCQIDAKLDEFLTRLAK